MSVYDELSVEELQALQKGDYDSISKESLMKLSTLGTQAANSSVHQSSNFDAPPPKNDSKIMNRFNNEVERKGNQSFLGGAGEALDTAIHPWKAINKPANLLLGTHLGEDLPPSPEVQKRLDERTSLAPDRVTGDRAWTEGFARAANSATGGLVNPVSAGISSVIDEGLQAVGSVPETPFGETYDYYKFAQQDRANQFKKENPGTAIAADIAGMAAPNSVFNVATGGANKFVQGLESKGIPFLSKMLSKPTVGRFVAGGLGNAAAGNLSEHSNDSMGGQLVGGVKDFVIGGTLNATLGKVKDVISGRVDKAKAPQEVQKLMDQLDEQFGHLKDPTERAQAIKQYVDKEMGGQLAAASEAGGAVKTGIENELNSSGKKIRDFYQEFTKGDKTKVPVENAKAYMQDFFQNHGLMDKAGNWIDDAGKVVSEPSARFGAGQTSDAQQQFLFDRFKDLYRNPDLNQLHDLKQVIQSQAFKGMDPLFGGSSKGIIKGLSGSLTADEEAAIRSQYGEELLQSFLKKKQAFAQAAEGTKGIAKKIGLKSGEGGFSINKTPEELVRQISKLPPSDLESLTPILKNQNVLDRLPEVQKAASNLNAIEMVGTPTNYQNIAKRLADNPDFFKSFEKSKGLLPPEALNQIKGDYLERVISKAGGDSGKISQELSKLGDTAKKSLFNEGELKIIDELQKQSSLGADKGFISQLLSKLAKGKLGLPGHLTDPLIQMGPSWLPRLLKGAGKYTEKTSPYIAREISSLTSR